MKNTVLLAIIFIPFISEGQARIAVKAGTNYTSIQNTLVQEKMIMLFPSFYTSGEVGFEHNFESKWGFEVGGTFEYIINDRFLLTTGLSVSQVNFQKKSPGVVFGNGMGMGTGFLNVVVPEDSFYGTQPFGQPVAEIFILYSTEKTGKTRITYVQIPLMAGVSLLNNSLAVRAGATFAYSPFSTEYKLDYRVKDYHESNPENINRVVMNATAGISYVIAKKFGIDLTANWSLNSIYKTNDVNSSVYSAGLSYILSK